jgi:hypothetical protein
MTLLHQKPVPLTSALTSALHGGLRAAPPMPFAWSAWRRLVLALVIIAALWLAVAWANGWLALLSDAGGAA